MFDRTKQHIVKRLMDEISCLDASELEIIAENVISYKESKRLIHHGINKNYKPVKSTIDAFSDDSTIAIECSTDQNYFVDSNHRGATTPHFQKIECDINHAVEHTPPNGPDKIYLITNQEEQPSFRNEFNRSAIYRQYGLKTTIYDSRELAKFVYDQSKDNKNAFAFYRQAFPDFAANMDNYEYYGNVPALCENHIDTPEIIQVIERHLGKGNNICILQGVSGSGKTQSAINYVHKQHNYYENILWISGDDWKKDTSLSSIQRTRGGAPINIAGIFNSQKTLLVIDSLERTIEESVFDELVNGFKKGGKVLITSQIGKSGDGNYLPIPTYSRNVAIAILGETEASLSENGKKVIEICSSSPLILATIRNLAKKEGIPREELYVEVINTPENITDTVGFSIVVKILSKLEPSTLEAFKKIANSGVAYHDSEFLVHFIGGLNRSNLQKISLLLPADTPGIIKAHDLLVKSIQDTPNSGVITLSIESYIDKNKGEMTPSVLREIHLCYSQLCAENARRGERRPDWIAYALIQIEGKTKYEICQQIYTTALMPDLPLSSVMSIIDAKESHAYTLNNKKREYYYRECAVQYQNAYNAATDEDIRLEYLHHRGKSLRRCGEYHDSLKCFNQILEINPEWYAALGQIAHLGAQKEAPKEIYKAGEDAITKLLQFIFDDKSKVPLRVALAMFARLRSYKNVYKEISSHKEEIAKLSDLIALSGLEGFGQFYEAYVSFTSMFSFDHPAVAIGLAEEIPAIFLQSPASVEDSQWVSACEGLVNTATAAESSGKPELFTKLKDAALRFADLMAERQVLGNYESRALAKAYLYFGNPQKALSIINKVKTEEYNHWLQYHKAKAELELGNAAQALDDAKHALELAIDDKGARQHIAAYYDLHSQCLEANSELELAIKEIEKAISHTSNPKYKTSLETRKSKMTDRL